VHFFHFSDILTASSVFPVFTPSKEKGHAAYALDKAEFYFQTLYEFVSFVKFVVEKPLSNLAFRSLIRTFQ